LKEKLIDILFVLITEQVDTFLGWAKQSNKPGFASCTQPSIDQIKPSGQIIFL
jgi:hypothetical protein